MPTIKQYPKGHVLIAQDSLGEAFYLIKRGEVEVYQVSQSGTEQQLRVLISGAHFGEISLLKSIPRTACVRTMTPCELVVFTHEEFLQLIASNPSLRESLEHEAAFLLRIPEE